MSTLDLAPKTSWNPSRMTKWAATWQNQQSDCAPSEDSDQLGHPPSLIRVFAVRMKKALSYPFSAQRRLWSDWADVQADESLLGAHSLCWFCHVTDKTVLVFYDKFLTIVMLLLVNIVYMLLCLFIFLLLFIHTMLAQWNSYLRTQLMKIR